MDRQFYEDDYSPAVKTLIQKFSDYQPDDLSKIITRYVNYEPEAVRAALYQAVEKGLIPYDLKELIWNQIIENMGPFKRNIMTFAWEKNNAFIPYFSSCTDDRIYDLIDDPDEMTLDVIHALLFTARDRELISEYDFQNSCNDLKSGNKPGVFENLIRIGNADGDYFNDTDTEADSNKFRKCPECNQPVEMEFDTCWNCQSEMPDVADHPGRAGSSGKKLDAGPFGLIKSGSYMIAAGMLIIISEIIRPYLTGFVRHTHLTGIIFGGLFIATGLAIVVIRLFDKDK